MHPQFLIGGSSGVGRELQDLQPVGAAPAGDGLGRAGLEGEGRAGLEAKGAALAGGGRARRTEAARGVGEACLPNGMRTVALALTREDGAVVGGRPLAPRRPARVVVLKREASAP